MRSIRAALDDLDILVEEFSAVTGGTNDFHHPEKLLENNDDEVA
mgnify:CR=1 FL=1